MEQLDYTVDEVANLLGLSTRTVYRDPSLIPGYYRIGGSIRFHKAAFDARQSLVEWRKTPKKGKVK